MKTQFIIIPQNIISNSLGQFNNFIKLSAAALVEVSTTFVTFKHQISQQLEGTRWLLVADGLELQNTVSLAVDVQRAVVKLKFLC